MQIWHKSYSAQVDAELDAAPLLLLLLRQQQPRDDAIADNVFNCALGSMSSEVSGELAPLWACELALAHARNSTSEPDCLAGDACVKSSPRFDERKCDM